MNRFHREALRQRDQVRRDLEDHKQSVVNIRHECGVTGKVIEDQREKIGTLLEALKVAKVTIQQWHGEVAWEEYQSSPEMKQINDAIDKLEKRSK